MFDYKFIDEEELEKTLKSLSKDKLDSLYPTWSSEDMLNLSTKKGKHVTFRFQGSAYKNDSYIGGIISDNKNIYCLVSKFPSLEDKNIIGPNRFDIEEIIDKTLAGNKIERVIIKNAYDARESSYVQVFMKNGQDAKFLFRPDSLIAIEYKDKKGEKIFAVEGADLTEYHFDDI